MCVCDTNTASMGRSVAAGVRSMRPRSTSSARPCQRSHTRSAGWPVCPFSRRGRKVVFMEPRDSMDPRRGWPASPAPLEDAPMPRGPRALIFYFDGMIVDDDPLHLAAFQEALAAE